MFGCKKKKIKRKNKNVIRAGFVSPLTKRLKKLDRLFESLSQ